MVYSQAYGSTLEPALTWREFFDPAFVGRDLLASGALLVLSTGSALCMVGMVLEMGVRVSLMVPVSVYYRYRDHQEAI